MHVQLMKQHKMIKSITLIRQIILYHLIFKSKVADYVIHMFSSNLLSTIWNKAKVYLELQYSSFVKSTQILGMFT